jgi:hypothetical protein
VSTTSFAASGSVSAYCIVPMRVWSVASTAMVRAVPSACGLPGHSAAMAAVARTHKNPAAEMLRINPRPPDPSSALKT